MGKMLNEYFIRQYETIDYGNKFPQDTPSTITLINDIIISEERIFNMIYSIDPSKAHWWDEISVRKIKWSNVALVIPLKIIFKYCIQQKYSPKYGNMQLWCLFIRKIRKMQRRTIIQFLPLQFLCRFSKNSYTTFGSFQEICHLLSITHSIFCVFDCNPPLEF